MNPAEIEQAIAKLTDEDAKKILAAEFPEELEKEASDEAAAYELQNAFYAYGAMAADLEIESECGELSKEASEEFAQCDAEITAAIEAGLVELGLDQIEDSVEFHKHAMAAATLVFEGYTDQIEKLAKKGGKEGGIVGTMKKHVGAAAEKAKALGASAAKHVKGFGKHVAKHPGKAGMIAAAGTAAGYGAHHLLHKKASELTADEMIDLTLEKQATLDVIADGIEKLAAHGGKKGAHLAGAMKHIKGFAKKHGKHGAISAGVGAAGYLAGRMHKKEK